MSASPGLVVMEAVHVRELLLDVLRTDRDERAVASTMPLLLGVVEVARRLGVSRATANKWRVEGCPAVLVGQTNYRFELEAVLAWLRNRK